MAFYDFKMSNMPTEKVMSHLALLSGRSKKVGCIERDPTNYERNEGTLIPI